MQNYNVLDKFPVLKDGVFLYKYSQSNLLVDASSISNMPLSRQQWSINESGILFLSKCNGEKTLSDNLDEFASEYGYTKEEKSSILNFALESLQKGHIVLMNNKCRKEIELFSNQGCNSGYPAHLSIELTYNCNLSCKHCYCGEYKNKTYINTDLLLEKIDAMVAKGALTVELTGGEPLMHPDFEKILRYCIDRFSLVALISNGTLFNDNIFNVLEKNKNKVIVSISLDGVNSSVHEGIRGVEGSFNKAVETIKKLRKKDIKVRIATVISKLNYKYIYEIASLAKKLDANWIGQSFIVPVGNGKDENLLLDREELLCSLEQTKRASIDFKDFYLEINENAKAELENGNCGAGWRTLAISPSGNIKLCVMSDEELSLGNIFKDKLEDIFSKDKVDYFCNIKSPNESICGDCKNLLFCKNCIVRPLEKIKDMGDECKWNKLYGYFDKLRSLKGREE